MSDTTATNMMSILTDEVKYGTGSNASQIYTTAGKTGTTNDEKDLWFTGMTGNLTTSVWLGSPDNYVIGGASSMAAGIYGSYLKQIINQDLLETTSMDRTSADKDTTPVKSIDSGTTTKDTTTDTTTDTKKDTTTDTTTPTTDTTTPTTDTKNQKDQKTQKTDTKTQKNQ